MILLASPTTSHNFISAASPLLSEKVTQIETKLLGFITFFVVLFLASVGGFDHVWSGIFLVQLNLNHSRM